MPLDHRVQALIAYVKRQFVDMDDGGKAAFLITAAAHFATETSSIPDDHSSLATCADCFASIAREQHQRLAMEKRN